MNRPKAYLRDRLYVPAEYCSENLLSYFESQVKVGYDPLGKQDIYETLRHYRYLDFGADQQWVAFNRGNLDKIYNLFQHEFEIEDQRIRIDMKHDLRIEFPEGYDFYKYQPDAIDALLMRDFGMLKAPARSGKTLMLTTAICAERQKTIVLAHQTDLLMQCISTFEKFTNLNKLRKQTGEKIIGIPQTWEEFEELDVVFCTKQTFDHPNNKKHLARIQQMFGYALVDEAHLASADLYSQYLNRFWAAKRQGCSATPARKDGLECVVEEIIGPIIHEIPIKSVNRVPVEVKFHFTGVTAKPKSFSYIRLLDFLTNLESRNEMIVKFMEEDVRNGHYIIAVTDRKEHIQTLSKMLESLKIPTVQFTGNLKSPKHREEVLNKMRSGEAKVMLSMRSMTTGLDIPRADYFYNLLPSSNAVRDGKNAGEGGYEQQCSRVLTNFPGKEKAIIRDFIDGIDICWGAKKQREKTYNKIGAVLNTDKEVEKKKEAEQLDLFMKPGSSTTF